MAYASHLQIVHGTTVLLDYGDMIESPPTIDGSQIVEVTPLVRASFPSIIPRGNEQHSIEFTLTEQVASAFESMRHVLEHSSTFNRSAAMVTITLNDGNTDYYELHNAVVSAWNSGHDSMRESLKVSITGGRLTRVPVLEPAEDWEGHAIIWEEA